MRLEGELQGGQEIPEEWEKEINQMNASERERVRAVLLLYLRVVDEADERATWRRN